MIYENNFKKNNRILLVDDNESIIRDYKRILSPGEESLYKNKDSFDSFLSSGKDVENDDSTKNEIEEVYELSFATQSSEAVTQVKDSLSKNLPFSLVFMDVRMPPGLDGIETVKKIFEIDNDIQVVLCTAHSDYSSLELLAKFGKGNERILLLRKPFDPQEILQLAASLTEKWDLALRNRNYTVSLEKALEDIKTLKKFIPICAKCKKMKDQNDNWYNFEEFLRDNSNYVLSHGFCPDCAIEAKQEIEDFREKLKQSRIID